MSVCCSTPVRHQTGSDRIKQTALFLLRADSPLVHNSLIGEWMTSPCVWFALAQRAFWLCPLQQDHWLSSNRPEHLWITVAWCESLNMMWGAEKSPIFGSKLTRDGRTMSLPALTPLPLCPKLGSLLFENYFKLNVQKSNQEQKQFFSCWARQAGQDF